MLDLPEQPTALAPVTAPPTWIGASSLGLAFGPASIARKPDGGLRFTVVPLPAYQAPDVTMAARADAVSGAFSGRLAEAVDIYRATVEQDGHMAGILATMAHGLLGLPVGWKGAGEMIGALADQSDATGVVVGDYSRMVPETEAAKILSDAIGLGFGLGQLVLMCWRCDGVEWHQHEGAQTCVTCGARAADRPMGSRRLYQLCWRDPRWLWRNVTTLEWWFTARQEMVRVRPGDGEWVMIRTVPNLDVWAHGPWRLGTESAIFRRDTRYDRQNTSRACAPTHVYKATAGGATDPRTRADIEAQADGVKFGNSLILPGEWDHRIDSPDGTYHDVAQGIIDDTGGQWEILITGNRQGTEAGPGFANADVYARVTRERRRFYATSWIRQIRAQVLTWWARENFGTDNAPVGEIDCDSPEDKKARGEADEQDGKAVSALVEGYDATGFELVPEYVVERAQARGVRIRPKAQPAPAPQQTPSAGEQDPAGPASPPPAPVPAPPPAPGGDEPADDEPNDDESARLSFERADAMNAAGLTACRHGRTNACTHCGVRGHWLPAKGRDGKATWAVSWSPLRARQEAPAAQDDAAALKAAIAELGAALEALDALPADDDAYSDADDAKGRLRAKKDASGHEHAADGKFGSGGGSSKSTKKSAKGGEKPAPKGTRDGLGRSKAAGVARGHSKTAESASESALAGGDHHAAAQAHHAASAQHREAAARSRKPEYREAHLRAAEAHERVAALHAKIHAVNAPRAPAPAPVAKPTPAPAAPAPQPAPAPRPAPAPTPQRYAPAQPQRPGAPQKGVASLTQQPQSKLRPAPGRGFFGGPSEVKEPPRRPKGTPKPNPWTAEPKPVRVQGQEPAAAPQKAPALPTSPAQDLHRFALDAHRAASESHEAGEGFGSSKAYLSDVAQRMGMPLAEFKAKAVAAHKAGHLTLARADLVDGMPAHKVQASEVEHTPGAKNSDVYNFINVAYAPKPLPRTSTAPAPAAPTASHEANVRRVASVLSEMDRAEPPGTLHSIRELRAKVPGMSKSAFDHAVLAIEKSGTHTLTPHDSPTSLPPEHRAALVYSPHGSYGAAAGESGTHYNGIGKRRGG